MMLHAQRLSGDARLPWLVWLHGFLGAASDWQGVGEALPHRQLRIDLPGHGGSTSVMTSGFAHTHCLLQRTLQHNNVDNYWLVGYSLGGRLAMYHACRPTPGLRGLIIEGGHPGLLNKQERRARRLADARWATRFRREPLRTVLDDWYQQPVFATMTPAQRAALISVRLHNQPPALAAMLTATSLGRQPVLHAVLAARQVPFHCLVGEKDARFQALATLANACYHILPNAGHNAHRDNPRAFNDCLQSLLLNEENA